MGFISKFLRWYGEFVTLSDERKSDYQPPDTGHWERKGSYENDQWEWIEKTKKLFVNVHHITDDYVITISDRPSNNPLDFMECSGMEEARRVVECYRIFYSNHGNVIIPKDLME